jgi:HK97 family phage major capsid protein
MTANPTLSVRAGRLCWAFPDGKILPYVGGGEGPTSVLDSEVDDLRAAITAKETEARTLKETIDADRERLRAEGVNLLTDDRFDTFDQRWKESDGAAQDALKLRKRLETVLLRAATERGVTGPGGGPAGGPAGPGQPLNRAERRQFDQLAKRYLESDAYKRIKESGVLRSEGRIHDDPVEVLERAELLDGLRQRTTVNIGDAGGVVPIDQQVWPPVVIPVRQVRLLDLISMTTTESDVVNWVKQTVRTDVAAETPYGTVAPEADYEFALQTAGVKRIPQFIPATKDILADQGQLQGLLQDQLMTGVRLKLEAQILAGTGTGFSDTTFQGMLQAAGIGTVTYQSAGRTTEYQLDAIHRAMTVIRLTLFSDPSAVATHPTDYESAVLKKDAYGRYLFLPNTEDDVRAIWGMQTVVTPVMTVGTALVGDFKQAFRMWIRTGLSVTASTEHLDFFTRGMVALLAEMRAAAATIQPRALCQVVGLLSP